MKNGLNRINAIDCRGCYVSVKKEWSDSGANSNFLIKSNEFINLAYMNSEWVRYYLSNKKVDGIHIGYVQVDFSYFAKYLKIAYEFLKKREEEEERFILCYYPNLLQIKEWPVVLSHWKIIHRVRKITEYQAKRFATYLQEDRLCFLKNLFETMPKNDNILPYASIGIYVGFGACDASSKSRIAFDFETAEIQKRTAAIEKKLEQMRDNFIKEKEELGYTRLIQNEFYDLFSIYEFKLMDIAGESISQKSIEKYQKSC